MTAEPRVAYYDGVRARARAVELRLAADAVEILDAGAVAARWPYDTIRRLDAAQYVLRLRSLEGPELARLEVPDPALAAALIARCPRLDEGRRPGRHVIARIVAWSLAAAASVILTVVYLVPIAADRLTPFIPPALEQRIGEAVDNQVRTLFGGTVCTNEPGRAALAKLSERLLGGATLPLPATISVLQSRVPNAIALPGGRIYLFDGLLQRADNPDEIAGVLAHEIGHVANRDGLRRLIQAGGSSFLLGLLFGDVTGGGTLILLGRTLVESSYSRGAEVEADRYAARTMLALGRSPQPMGRFLLRITGSQKNDPLPFLKSHPVSEDRLAALSAQEPKVPGPPLLTDEEWRSLKSICRSG